jgi:uncharacterized protein YciI
MKHFVIEITYHVPAEQLGETVGEHRAFLDGGYQSGLLLMSGPQKPKIGGMVIARAESVDDLRAFSPATLSSAKGWPGTALSSLSRSSSRVLCKIGFRGSRFLPRRHEDTKSS